MLENRGDLTSGKMTMVLSSSGDSVGVSLPVVGALFGDLKGELWSYWKKNIATGEGAFSGHEGVHDSCCNTFMVEVR